MGYFENLFIIVLATFIVSIISFVGVIFLSFKKEFLNKLLPLLVSFAVGVILGDVFIHIMPESINNIGNTVFIYTLTGFIFFFTIEKILAWHHHWRSAKKHEPIFTNQTINLILLGDCIHNFLDGVIIASSFLTNFTLGVFTTFAIILHEIPQEIGDFAVLLKFGMKRRNAILFNFISAIFAIIGGIVTFFFLESISGLVTLFLPITAGGLLYIASADLIPELHQEKRLSISLLQVITLIFGVTIFYYLKLFIG